MARREDLELRIKVTGDDDVKDLADSFEDVEDAAKSAGKAGEAAAKALVADWDAVGAQAKETASIMKTLGDALGEDASKFDLQRISEGLQEAGLDAKQAAENIELITDGLRRLDSAKGSIDQLGVAFDSTRTKVDGMRSSSDQSRSVLANLAGNAAQDLGELGGVAGTAGVALGQLAEYAADGNIQLRNLAGTTVTIAGVAAAVQAVTSVLSEWNAAAELTNRQMRNLAENLDGASFSADEYAAALAASEESLSIVSDESRSIKNLWTEITEVLKPGNQDIQDMAATLGEAGLSVDQFAEAVTGGIDDLAGFEAALLAAREAGRITNDEYVKLVGLIDREIGRVSEIEANAAEIAKATADSMDDVNTAMTEQARVVGEVETFWSTLLADMRDGKVDTDAGVASWNKLRQELGLSEEAMAEMVAQKLADADASDEATEGNDELAAKIEEARLAAEQFAAALTGVNAELNSAQGRADAFAAATERFERIHPPEISAAVEVQGVIDDLDAVVEAYQAWVDAVGETDFGAVDVVPDSWDEIQGLPDDLPPVLDALAAFRGSMQSEMAQAFERGGPSELRDWAAKMEAGVRESLSNVEGITEEQVEAILHALLLLPEDAETTIRISQGEQVLGVIDDVVSGLGEIPPQVAANIAMAVNNKDPDEALRILNEHLASIGEEPVTITVNAETGEFEIQMGDAIAPRDSEVKATSNADEVGGDLDTAAEDRDSVINVTAPNSDKTKGTIDKVAAPRTATITALAEVRIAELLLNLVARDRIADIFAMPHAHEYVESLLNNVARDRTADIYTVVHGAGGGGGGGGGGATPQAVGTLAAPGVGLMAAPTAAPMATTISAVTQTPFTPAPPFSPTINIQAGVLGNHFDVERTVARALRRYQRINGRRGT